MADITHRELRDQIEVNRKERAEQISDLKQVVVKNCEQLAVQNERVDRHGQRLDNLESNGKGHSSNIPVLVAKVEEHGNRVTALEGRERDRLKEGATAALIGAIVGQLPRLIEVVRAAVK